MFLSTWSSHEAFHPSRLLFSHSSFSSTVDFSVRFPLNTLSCSTVFFLPGQRSPFAPSTEFLSAPIQNLLIHKICAVILAIFLIWCGFPWFFCNTNSQQPIALAQTYSEWSYIIFPYVPAWQMHIPGKTWSYCSRVIRCHFSVLLPRMLLENRETSIIIIFLIDNPAPMSPVIYDSPHGMPLLFFADNIISQNSFLLWQLSEHFPGWYHFTLRSWNLFAHQLT